MSEAWAAIIAALIAGIAATFGLVITKENKTSEFRQAWIAELRGLLTSYTAILVKFNLEGDFPIKGNGEKAEQISKLSSEIRLRLNLSKPSKEEQALVSQMKVLAENIESEPDHFFSLIHDFNVAAFGVLKGEWKRVKRGEFKYRVCLSFSVFVTACLLVLIGFYSYFHHQELIKFITG